MKRFLVGSAFLVAYFALTWFFFGSPHPCGILEATQRPHFTEKARASHEKDRRLAYDLIKTMDPKLADMGTSILETLNDLERSVPIDLQRKITLMTPAEFAWQAITWSPPKVAGRSGAGIPEGYRELRPDEEVLPH
jgi:hypothetical protein